MKPIRIINGFLTAILAFTCQAGTVHAAESASYIFEGGTITNASPSLRSEHFAGQGQIEWLQAPLRGSTFVLVPSEQAGGQSYASDSSSSSSSSSSVSSSSASETTGGTAPSHGGGYRGTVQGQPSSASPSSSVSSMGSSASSVGSGDGQTDTDIGTASSAASSQHSVGTPRVPATVGVSHKAALKTAETALHSSAGLLPSASLRPQAWVVADHVPLLEAEQALFAKAAAAAAAIGMSAVAIALWLLRNPLLQRKLLKSTLFNVLKSLWKRNGRIMKHGFFLLLFALGAVLLAFSHTSAANLPLTHAYNGRLLTASGTAVTTPVTIRLSYWSSADHVGGDTTGGGAINTGAATYLSWSETHTVTPDDNGYFSVEMGSVTPLPGYNSLPAGVTVYLQTEVKADADPDTSYEILDPAATDSNVDRTAVLSVPYASMAQTLDRHSVGTSSGSIPYLLSGGLLPVGTVPNRTNYDSFTLDADNSAATAISLTFGTTLAKTLSYDIANGRFEFNDDLKVTGDLTVTGTVNGALITAETITPLLVTRSSGRTVAVASGSYRLNGTSYSYGGGTITLADNTSVNYVYFTSTGLTSSVSGFPTDTAYIPLARVSTSGGAVQTITDARALQSDDRESTDVTALHPEYDGATVQADGSDNVGQLLVSHDAINLKNFYLWTSSRSSLQDYDILVRAALPADFTGWNDGITLQYRSTSASTANNALAVQVYDTNGSPVTLSGSVTNLASTSWASTHIEFTGSPTWTKGQEFLVRLKLSAKDDYQMHAGDLKFSYRRLSAP